MSRVLTMMSKRFNERMGRTVELAHAVDDLRDQREAFAEDFDEFFPALIAFAVEPGSQKTHAETSTDHIR